MASLKLLLKINPVNNIQSYLVISVWYLSSLQEREYLRYRSVGYMQQNGRFLFTLKAWRLEGFW